MAAESQNTGQQPGRKRRLSHFSSIFLRTGADPSLSSRCKPWVVMAKLFFAEEIDPDRLWKLFCLKLAEFPRFRSVAVFSGRHVFMEEVPAELDKAYHLRSQVTLYGLEGWTEDDVHEYMSALRQQPLELARPLWRLHVLNHVTPRAKRGEKAPQNDEKAREHEQHEQEQDEQEQEHEENDGKEQEKKEKKKEKDAHVQHCLLIEVDHAIGDGITFLATLLSLSSLASSAIDPAALPRPRPLPDMGWLAQARWASEGVLSWMQHQFLRDSTSALKKHSYQSLNSTLSQKQVTADSEHVPLSTVKEIAATIPGSSVNVILSSAMALAVQAYLREAGESELLHRKTIRAQFMITMRGKGGGGGGRGGGGAGGGLVEELMDGEAGSQTTTDSFMIPFAASRLDMLRRIQYQSFRSRLSPAPWLQLRLLGLLEPLPSWLLLRLYLYMMSKFTVLSSNIAGPQQPCSILDMPLCGIRYYAFLPHHLYWGFMSYNGNVTASVVADAAVVEDPSRLMLLFNEELQLLYKEAVEHQELESSKTAGGSPGSESSCLRSRSPFQGGVQLSTWSIGALLIVPLVAYHFKFKVVRV